MMNARISIVFPNEQDTYPAFFQLVEELYEKVPILGKFGNSTVVAEVLAV